MMKKLICFLLLSFATTSAADVKVAAFMRHTFRGIFKTIGPQHIKLPAYGIDITIPNLSYVEDAMPHGLVITRDYAARALQAATDDGLSAVGEKTGALWNEIRPDLATERTFWTGLYLRDGLYEVSPSNLSLNMTACATEPEKAIDVVSARGPVMKCLKDHIAGFVEASPHLVAFKRQAQDFLGLVRQAIGISGEAPELPHPDYHVNGTFPHEYTEAANLASFLVMSATLGAPLPKAFKDRAPAWLNAHGKTVVEAGVEMLGIRFFVNNPEAVADAVSLFPLQYVDALDPNHKAVVLTHDDVISNLLRSLGIISSTDDPSTWAIYPMETVIMVISDTKASIVRMRLKVQESDGSIPGDFEHQLVWSGSRAEWENKVKSVYDRAAALDISVEARKCLDALQICDAQPLEVLY